MRFTCGQDFARTAGSANYSKSTLMYIALYLMDHVTQYQKLENKVKVTQVQNSVEFFLFIVNSEKSGWLGGIPTDTKSSYVVNILRLFPNIENQERERERAIMGD